MNTEEFFRRILPTSGYYVLMYLQREGPKDQSNPVDHRVYTDLQTMAADALRLDATGCCVYHARASFAKSLDPNNGMRTEKNAQAVRSLSVDLDVKPNDPSKHESEKDAYDQLVLTCNQLNLPIPLVVNSGRGLHAYWPLDQDVPVAEAMPLAKALHKALKFQTAKPDPTITAHPNAVLRPIGTHWRKEGEREVQLREPHEAVFTVAEIRKALAGFIESTGADNLDEWRTTDLTQPRTWPDSSAATIAQHCPALADFRDKRGVVDEPLWRACLGVIKYCADKDPLAYEWSSGHESYSKEETDAKMGGWTEKGPATCECIRNNGGACDGCTREIKSPIHLGYSEEAPSAPLPPVLLPEAVIAIRTDHACKDPGSLPFFPTRYRWNGAAMERSYRADDGTIAWQVFADRWFYPYQRVRLENNASAAMICALGARGNWRTFAIKTETLADDSTLYKLLAAQEIYPLGGKHARGAMKEYLLDILRCVEAHEDETRTIQALGWYDDGFVLGNTYITATAEYPIVLSDRVPEKFRTGLDTSGTVQEWVELVDRIYNRPGAIPYQVAILAGFAAPLVQLAASGLWHGIPIALTGGSGLGKTTTCLVAASIYGNPATLLTSAHGMGTTLNALIQRVAVVRNLPLIMDELHELNGADLPMLLYALSNGRPKDRLRADSSFRDEGEQWNTLTFITSNQNITALLGQHDQSKAEATQIRVFEIPLDDNAARAFSDINAKDLIENQLLQHQYGVVGRRFLQLVCRNKDKLTAAIQQQRAAHTPLDAEMSKERFFYDLKALLRVVGSVLHKAGIIRFDLDAIDTWIDYHIRTTLRKNRELHLSSLDDQIQTLFAHLVDRTVYTEQFPRGRLPRDYKPQFIEWRGRFAPIARYSKADRVLIVVNRGLRDLCRELKIPMGRVLDRLEQIGAILPLTWASLSDESGRVCPFRGTDMINSGTQARSHIINLAAMSDKIDLVQERAAANSNVIPIKKEENAA